MDEITAVIFRKYRDGEVIALFPESPAEVNGRYCDSYMPLGQHGGADFAGVVASTKPAKPEEYAPLKHELESAPYRYKLKVYSRQTPQHRAKFEAELKRYLKAV